MCRAIQREIAVCLAAAMPAIQCACRQDTPRGPGEQVGFIAVVGIGRPDPLWPVLRAAAARAGASWPRTSVRVEAPERVSANLQIRLVDRLKKQGMRGLCIQVHDAAALAGRLESLRSGGVVVVTMMREIESHPPFLHSGIDPEREGGVLADALAGQIPDGGTLAVLYQDGNRYAHLRRSGFQTRIAQVPGITVLREWDCGGSPARAVELMREGMERFPGIDGWAAMGAWPLGAPPGDRPLLPPRCALVLPGLLPDIGEALTTRRCQAVIVADYDAIVTRAMEMCWIVLEREIVQIPVFLAPPRTVTPESLEAFRRDWSAWTTPPKAPGDR